MIRRADDFQYALQVIAEFGMVNDDLALPDPRQEHDQRTVGVVGLAEKLILLAHVRGG